MRLQDKIVLITGAGSGLGRESALLFAREGATVVVTDVRSERAERVASEIGAAGGKAIGLQTDVRSEQAVAEAVDTAVDHFGRLDEMYANAGVGPVGFGSVRFEDLTDEDWDAVDAVNNKGVIFSVKQAARVMITEKTDPARAEALLRRYLEVEPEIGYPSHAGAHWRIGQALEQLGRKPEAIAEMQTALKMDPSLDGAKRDLKRLKQ